MSAHPIKFITGTDTGAGKTLLTAFLLHHARSQGRRTLAMKPFCSGGLSDVRLLQSLQPGELSQAAMNPFYFAQPLAPLAASSRRQKPITLAETVSKILSVRAGCDELIVEGSGGLLVPLGKNFVVADLIAALDCDVFIAAQNRLGVINHTLLTVEALIHRGIKPAAIKVVLMALRRPDLSAQTNAKLLRQLLPVKVVELPYLPAPRNRASAIRRHYQKIKNCSLFRA